MLASPLASLLLGDMSQLVYLGRIASNHALGDLDSPADHVGSCDRVLNRLCLNSNATNTRIVLRAIVCSVA